MINSLASGAKEQLCKLASQIDLRLDKYWKEEAKSEFGFEKQHRALIKEVLEHAREHNMRSAKRLRASFVYFGYTLSGKKPDKEIWKVMEGVELVQTSLLMHDDFMDEDLLRRGLPTTHEFFAKGDKHYGNCMAVNIGDAVLCLGYELVLECGLESEKVLKASRILMRGIANTAYGQIYDMSLPKLGKLTEDKVLALHRAKTSIYTFQNPLLMGALLGGLDEEVLEVLRKYSLKGGIAFQLQDDILGMFGDSNRTGKSANSDLLQGKSTLLIAKTLELGNNKQKQDLMKAWGKKNASAGEISKAKKAIEDSGSLEYSKNKASELADEAVEIAEGLNKFKLDKKSINYLKGVVEYAVCREL